MVSRKSTTGLLVFFSVHFLSSNHGVEKAKCLTSLHNFSWLRSSNKILTQPARNISFRRSRQPLDHFVWISSAFHLYFLFQDSLQIPHLIQLLHFLSLLLSVRVSQCFLIFMILTYLGSIAQVFCRMFYNVSLSDVLFMITLGFYSILIFLYVFGEYI